MSLLHGGAGRRGEIVRAWMSSVVHERLVEIALAIALGYATVTLAFELSNVAVGVLAQHVGRDPYGGRTGTLDLFTAQPFFLNFNIGKTVIVYGDALAQVITLGLVALAGLVIVRRRDRELGVCPYCASRIPYASTTCAFCASAVEPGEPSV